MLALVFVLICFVFLRQGLSHRPEAGLEARLAGQQAPATLPAAAALALGLSAEH